jgi:hypothetical protein
MIETLYFGSIILFGIIIIVHRKKFEIDFDCYSDDKEFN